MDYGDEVAASVLVAAEEADDDRHDVQEVGGDGQPLVAQQVEHLPLHRRDLQSTST